MTQRRKIHPERLPRTFRPSQTAQPFRPRPKTGSPDRFGYRPKTGVPVFGIVASTVLASIAMAINYIGSGGGGSVFTTLGADDRHHLRHSVCVLRAGAD